MYGHEKLILAQLRFIFHFFLTHAYLRANFVFLIIVISSKDVIKLIIILPESRFNLLLSIFIDIHFSYSGCKSLLICGLPKYRYT